MRMNACIFSTLVAAAINTLPGTGFAATFAATASVAGLCSIIDNDTDGASASCGSSFGTAGPGSLSAAVQAFILISSEGISSFGNASASARMIDTVFFEGLENGFISIPLDFAGSIEFATKLDGSGRVGARGDASAGMNGETFFSVTATFDSLVGDSVFGNEAEVKDVTIPIVNGRATVRASLGIAANCQLVAAGNSDSSCRATVDYGSSLRFLGATVFDELGVQRDDVEITSESGFDYRRGVEPHVIPPAVIPLPASGILFLTTLLGIAVVRRRASIKNPRIATVRD